MARIWTEIADPRRHVDYMSDWSAGGLPVRKRPHAFVSRRVLLVEVYAFTFQFHSMSQLNTAIEYFKKAHHPSSREPDVMLEHDWHPWYQRLPAGLNKHSKRVRILAALKRALAIHTLLPP
jgi:hypothetical protein